MKFVTRQSSSVAATAGAMPELRGRFGCQPLGLAVYAEQVGVLAGQPDHVVGAAQRRAEVAVGDAAAQRVGLAAERTERPLEAPQDVAEVVHSSQATLHDKAHKLYLHNMCRKDQAR